MAAVRRHFTWGLLVGAVAVLLLGLLTFWIVVNTGFYNVAASEEHTPLVRWTMMTTMRNSAQRHAADIEVPEPFTEADITAGAIQYKAMCEHCHGGPGAPRANWASGMLPKPPGLSEAAERWETQEVFWLVKHGIKMTGMPAFGETHDDEALWTIAAFVDQLPSMTAEDYQTLGPQPTGGHSH